MRNFLRGRGLTSIIAMTALPLLAGAGASVSGQNDSIPAESEVTNPFAPLGNEGRAATRIDSVFLKNQTDTVNEASRYDTLTDADFEKVAKELGVEVAAIRAVVSIEAGPRMKGFWAPGVPVVNFDRVVYNRLRRKEKVRKAPASEKVPDGLKGYGLNEWTQLVKARKQNLDAANKGTFWGMFQIGGFNYKRCECESVEQFIELMSRSELDQLELFAIFIRNAGMLPELRAKNWKGFARKYNGPGYARRGYHTKMAAAYRKFSKQSPSGKSTKQKPNQKK